VFLNQDVETWRMS